MSREYWKPGNLLSPVPAVMVSCRRPGEKPNIITIAWAGTICSDPVMVSVSVRPERYSYNIIKETGEFVINLVDKNTVKACDWCGVKSGKDFDKYKEMKLTEEPSKTVAAPGIAECPVSLECKVKDIIPLGSHDMFLAEVTAVSVNAEYINEKGGFDMNNLGLVAFSHGAYVELGKTLGTFGFSVRKTARPSKKTASPIDRKSRKS